MFSEILSYLKQAELTLINGKEILSRVKAVSYLPVFL